MLLVLLVVIFGFLGCSPKSADIKVNKIPGNGVVIDKWQILGPIPVDKKNDEPYIECDKLKLFGSSETGITFAEYIDLGKTKLRSDSVKLKNEFANSLVVTGELPLEIVDGKYSEFENKNGIFYAVSSIKCSTDLSVMLHYGCNVQNKVWLNNKLVCSNDYALYAWSYQNYIPIDLKKGENLLMVKMYKPDKAWELYARLENPSDEGGKRCYESRNHIFLKNSVIKNNERLEFDQIFPPSSGKIVVLDRDRKVVFSEVVASSEKWGSNLPFVEEGCYVAKYEVEGIVIEQDFYKGDLGDTTKRVFEAISKIQVDDKVRRNIAALEYRFNHLSKQSWVDWKKIVQIFIEAQKAYLHILDSKDPFNHTSGCFIRSYISVIDDSEQYYILHVPSSYMIEKPSAVMLVIPTNGGKMPYLESYRVANFQLINIFQDLAEKYNMIVIEPGSRHLDKVIYNALEENEIFNIISDVRADYSLDLSRLYLSSACSGGNDALKLAVKYPDRFAALGLISPSINHGKSEVQYSKFNYPVNYLSNCMDLPMLVIHSRLDRHVPIKISKLLEKEVRKSGKRNFSFNVLPSEFQYYYTNAFFDDVFNYVQKFKLDKNPTQVHFTTNQTLYNKSFWIHIDNWEIPEEAHIHAKLKGNRLIIKKRNILAYSIDLKTLPYHKEQPLTIVDNGKLVLNTVINDSMVYIGSKLKPDEVYKNNTVAGPLADVFSKRFILVKGTSGTQKEVNAISALADSINKYWNERYFVNCIVKNDFEVTKKDMAESGLVLLGNAQSNHIISEMSNYLPLSVSNFGIQIMDKKIEGRKLSFYMVYPNPINKTKYLGVIGYNNPDFISLGSETMKQYDDVSNYGWYDYKVWCDSSYNNLITSGYFDSTWN